MAEKCNKKTFGQNNFKKFSKGNSKKSYAPQAKFFFNFAPQAKIFQKSSVILYIMAPQARKILYTISGGPPETVSYTISEGGGGEVHYKCAAAAAAHFLKQANRPKSAQNRSTDPSQPRTQVLFRIPRT